MASSFMNEVLGQISKRNRNVVAGTIYDMQANWKSWYRSDVNAFHNYNLIINGNTKQFQRLSLNMAKKLCEDWGSLLFNEKVTITVDNEEANEVLHDVLKKNNFVESESNFIEKVFALGTGATIEYLSKRETKISFVDGDLIVISGHHNSIANMLTTINVFVIDDVNYTHLTYHDFVDGVYIIEHEVYESDDELSIGNKNDEDILLIFTEDEANAMTEKDDEGNIRYMITYENIDRPLFQVLKPNIANNYDTESPMGISIFANSIDTLRAVDTKYDGYTDEFVTNKSRIFVSDQALKEQMKEQIDKDGTQDVQFIRYFDADDTVIQGVPMHFDEDGNLPIKSIQFLIREEEYRNGINGELSLLASKTGFGANFYNFGGTVVHKTIPEVVNENKEAHKNRVKHQLILHRQLEELCRGVLYLENSLGNVKIDSNKVEISIMFDDSVIQDKETERLKDEKAVEMGAMPLVIFVMKWYNLTENEAKEWLRLSEEETKKKQDAILGGIDIGDPDPDITDDDNVDDE